MLTVLKSPVETGYNKCISCEALGVSCDGPNLTAVSPDRFCEWCRLRKEYLGWTNAHLIEISGVSKATVDRVMAGTVAGLNGDTKSRIACALIRGVSSNGNAWGRNPCPMGVQVPGSEPVATGDDIERLKADYEKKLSEVMANDRNKIEFLIKQVEFKELQMLNKDKLLDERAEFIRSKDRTIRMLAVLLGVSVLIIIAALLIDRIDPSVGFFWREAMTAVIS